MFDGFVLSHVDVGATTLRVRHGGAGPAVVLLHGHPRTHTTWYQVAPALADRFSVVCPDLRGYGQSTAPPTTEDHRPYSKRAMAGDVVELMHRLAADHPDVVTALVRMGAENYADLHRAIHDPLTVHAMCEDYRAGLGPDRANDDEDRAAGRRLRCPTLLLWSSRDDMVDLYGDPLAVWRDWADDVRGHELDSGSPPGRGQPDGPGGRTA